jgi:hypothetical protein
MFRWMKVTAALGMAVAGVAVAVTLTADGPQTVQVRDDCDPATFNAGPPAGPGLGPICDENFDGDTTFTEFIDEVTAEQSAEKWRFNPDKLDEPRTLVPRNRGGETHTFTRVAAFGGGIIPLLNDLSGNPKPAAECLDAAKFNASAIPAGGSLDPIAAKSGDKFQCCIHPWMRTTVRKR